MPPKEELCWMDKGGAPFVGWSINMARPFPQDEDGNRYLLIAVDLFSKLVDICAVTSLHGWRVAEFYTMTWLPIGASRAMSGQQWR